MNAVTLGVTVFLSLTSAISLAQHTQAGTVAGTVTDPQGAVIVDAAITLRNTATGEARHVTSDRDGRYVIASLNGGTYTLTVNAAGFTPVTRTGLHVPSGGVTTEDVQLALAPLASDVTVTALGPVMSLNTPTIARSLDTMTVSELPLPTRNFTQLIGLVSGATTYLNDNTLQGQQSMPVSVNGARVTQNDYRVNGVDANDIAGNGPQHVPLPAPESLEAVTIRTSLFDATVGRSGGAVIDAVTRSGSDTFHGGAYEYFRHEALAANDPALNAVGIDRPELRRNVYGVTLGGPIRRGRSHFFTSYQGTHEHNGYNGIYSNVLIAPGLTDDRSESTLLNTFAPTLPDGTAVTRINPVSLHLLNSRLPDGSFLLPTPQANGRVSGFAVSRFREEQLNANATWQLADLHRLAAKFFFSNAPSFSPLGEASLPGFGVDGRIDNRLLSIEDNYAPESGLTNELRFGYGVVHTEDAPQEPVNDVDLGIVRPTAAFFPGLPMIAIASAAGGAVIGSPLISTRGSTRTLAIRDVLSLHRGRHDIRTGGELRWYRNEFRSSAFSRGDIEFLTFNDFLTGSSFFSFLGTGTPERDFRTSDIHVFAQDDWRVTPALTLNLGLRYELDLPPYDAQGRLSTFDPRLYRPPTQSIDGFPVPPPAGGLVQAENVSAAYDLSDIPNVNKRLLDSLDPNNLAPRIGFAWVPTSSGRTLIRAGYGHFYSRSAFEHDGIALVTAPFWATSATFGAPFENPFPPLPPPDAFPQLVPGEPFHGPFTSRGLRTPWLEHFNVSFQTDVAASMRVELAYVGSRGHRLSRLSFINQATLASPAHPVVNQVTGEVITTNTIDNAGLRAPYQGVGLGGAPGFAQAESTGYSTYHSLQASLSRRYSRGLQLLASYTWSKSLDNSGGGGGGANADGTIDVLGSSDLGASAGNQLDPNAFSGLSDFDRTHRLVLSFIWDAPTVSRGAFARTLFSDWQFSGILTAMSGLPINVTDSAGGSIYGAIGAQPNWSAGSNRQTATSGIPPGYFFNPMAFALAFLSPGQPIPSSNGQAIAEGFATDFGNVGRNILRGPSQRNVDLSVTRRIRMRGSSSLQLRADFFNLFNHVNYANPISDVSAVVGSGGEVDQTGRIVNPGDFGRIINTSSSQRILQLAVKFTY